MYNIRHNGEDSEAGGHTDKNEHCQKLEQQQLVEVVKPSNGANEWDDQEEDAEDDN